MIRLLQNLGHTTLEKIDYSIRTMSVTHWTLVTAICLLTGLALLQYRKTAL